MCPLMALLCFGLLHSIAASRRGSGYPVPVSQSRSLRSHAVPTLCHLLVEAVASPLRFQGKEQRILEPCFQIALLRIWVCCFQNCTRVPWLRRSWWCFFAKRAICVCGTQSPLGESMTHDAHEPVSPCEHATRSWTSLWPCECRPYQCIFA